MNKYEVIHLPIGFCPAVTASKVTTFPGSDVTLNAFGLTSVKRGLSSAKQTSSTLDLRALIISLAEPRLMLIELRIKGVTEYSVCSRSFSSASVDESHELLELKSSEEAVQTREREIIYYVGRQRDNG